MDVQSVSIPFKLKKYYVMNKIRRRDYSESNSLLSSKVLSIFPDYTTESNWHKPGINIIDDVNIIGIARIKRNGTVVISLFPINLYNSSI